LLSGRHLLTSATFGGALRPYTQRIFSTHLVILSLDFQKPPFQAFWLLIVHLTGKVE
jgi:hypothetical protein